MRIRSTYFKVRDMAAAVSFWRQLLGQEPAKVSTHWAEFLVGEVRLGFLLNDFGEAITGNSAVPVIELAPADTAAFVERAQSLGATVVLDGLNDPQMKSIVLATPAGQEFELCSA